MSWKNGGNETETPVVEVLKENATMRLERVTLLEEISELRNSRQQLEGSYSKLVQELEESSKESEKKFLHHTKEINEQQNQQNERIRQAMTLVREESHASQKSIEAVGAMAKKR